MRDAHTTPTVTNILDALAVEYSARGWTVRSSAIGLELVTGPTLCGIELPADLALDIHKFLRVHLLAGPVIELPTVPRRHIVLAATTGVSHNAMATIRDHGLIVHTSGARIPLPPTYLLTGPVRWFTAPMSRITLPPVVAVSAALRAVASPRWHGAESALAS